MSRRMPAPKWSLLVITGVIAVVAFVASSCAGDDGPGADEARMTVDGSVTVTSSDGATEIVTDSATLAFGDLIVVDDGTATIELAAGQTYEFRSGEVDAEVLVDAPPRLHAGDGLVTGGFPAALVHDTTTVSAHGPLKLSAEIPAAASYASGARISGAGALDHVAGLRQVVLTSSATPTPLDYDAADAWDRRFLGEAIAFGERLEALARGYTRDLPPGERSVRFYEAVLPPLAAEREFSADLLDDDRPTGETLVGAAIVVQGRSGTFRERWTSVFAFRDEGAAWGLVALDQGVSSAPVLDTIELAITEASTPDTTGDTSTSTSPTTDTTTTEPPTSDTTTTTSPPPTDPPPPEQDDPLQPVLTPVGEIVNDVLDALGLSSAPSE